MQSFKILGLALLITCFTSCSKKDSTPPDPNVTFKATLNGASEATPNGSTATGSSTLVFNTSTKIFTVTTTYTGITATAAHIHKGVIGISGPIIFGFTSLPSPIIFTSAALDATQEADLNANLYYTNIHSTAFPGGEIRGQLIKQ